MTQAERIKELDNSTLRELCDFIDDLMVINIDQNQQTADVYTELLINLVMEEENRLDGIPMEMVDKEIRAYRELQNEIN